MGRHEASLDTAADEPRCAPPLQPQLNLLLVVCILFWVIVSSICKCCRFGASDARIHLHKKHQYTFYKLYVHKNTIYTADNIGTKCMDNKVG